MKEQKITIIMPVYNGLSVLSEALESILMQSYSNFQVIISDDASTDRLQEIFKKNKSNKIIYSKNITNLGYGKNMELLRHMIPTDTDVVLLMAQDDLLAKDSLKLINSQFQINPTIGAIIRPFYMFGDNVHKPIRDFGPPSRTENMLININDDERSLFSIINTVCQLSGLAFRYRYFNYAFHEHVMTSHIYPFMEIFKHHPVLFLKDYIVAVRTYSSQTRHVPNIYEYSAQEEWGLMVRTVFKEKKYAKVKQLYLKFVYQNFISLVQLKNFSTMKILIREYWIFIKNRPTNLVNLKYWFFVLGTLITPKQILLPLVDWYKERVLSLLIKKNNIRFFGVKAYD